MEDDPPFCSNCGYRLSGLVDSSKCPECGRPLVEILTRKSYNPVRTYRFRSKATVFGWPVVDIIFTNGRDGKMRVAKGIVAIGNVACGGIAIGAVAAGIVSIGVATVGLFPLGILAVGVFCLGNVSVGVLSAGNVAIGLLASGNFAAGEIVQGRVAVGPYARALGSAFPHATSPRVFWTFRWFFGRTLNFAAILQSFLFIFLCDSLACALISAVAYTGWLKNPGKQSEP